MSADLCLVGYTFRNYPAEFALAQAKRHGYAGVELRDFRGFDWSGPPALRKTLPTVAALARERGVEPWAVFHAIEMPDSAKTESALAEYEALLSVLRQHAIRIWHAQVRVPGVGSSREAGDEHYRAAGAFLTRLGKLAAKEHVTVAIESHMGTLHDTAAAQWRLLEQCESDAVAASLDFVNLCIENEREGLEAVVRRFGQRIGYVHLKNVVRRGGGWDWNIPLRMGDIDYRRLLPVLRSHYGGPLGVEYCGPGDPAWVVADDAAYLLGLLGA